MVGGCKQNLTFSLTVVECSSIANGRYIETGNSRTAWKMQLVNQWGQNNKFLQIARFELILSGAMGRLPYWTRDSTQWLSVTPPRWDKCHHRSVINTGKVRWEDFTNACWF